MQIRKFLKFKENVILEYLSHVTVDSNCEQVKKILTFVSSSAINNFCIMHTQEQYSVSLLYINGGFYHLVFCTTSPVCPLNFSRCTHYHTISYFLCHRVTSSLLALVALLCLGHRGC